MERITLDCRDKAHWLAERTQDLTSTDIAALFGCSPYKTHFELWHEKAAGTRNEIATNERMIWGTRLEATIAEGVAEDHGWTVRPMKQYMRLPVLRIGSSFDFSIDSGSGPVAAMTGPGILEVKNVDSRVFRDGWIVEDDYIEAPPHIEMQVQHQLLVTGRAWAAIAALVGGNDLRMVYRLADPEIHQAILAKAAAFWASIDAGAEPAPDFTRDLETIARLYAHAEPGKVVQTDDARLVDLAAAYTEAAAAEKAATERQEAAKAEMLTLIGDAEKIVMPGFSISAGVVGPTHVEYDRKGYRNFRVYQKKGK